MASSQTIKDQTDRLQFTSTDISPTRHDTIDTYDLDRSFYPSHAELYHLSKLLYDTEDVQMQAGDWKLLMTAEDEKYEYFGAAFWHQESEHLVIAHRGTKNVKTFVRNLREIVSGVIVHQVFAACIFTQKVAHKYYQSIGSISITGHLLGGWMAQISAFVLQYLTVTDKFYKRRKNDVKFHPHTVTFGNPGSYEKMLKLVHHFFPDANKDFISKLDITNCFISPNVVNACSKQTGRIVCFDLNRACYKKSPEILKVLTDVTYVGNVTEYLDLYYYRIAFDHDVAVYEVKNWPIVAKYKTAVEMLTSATEEELNFHFKFDKKAGNVWSRMDFIVDHDYCYDERERYDDKVAWKNVFSGAEIRFLESWKRMQSWNEIPSKAFVGYFNNNIKEDFLPNFEISNEIVKCEDMDLLINRTKWLISTYPHIPEDLKLEMSAVQGIVRTMFNTAMNNYLQTLPKYDLDFKDTIGLINFVTDPKENVLVLAAENVKDEAFRIYSILKRAASNFCFLSWTDFHNLGKYFRMESVIMSSSVGDNLIVIDCENEKSYCSILDGDVLKQYKKKVILLVKSEIKNEIKLTDLTDDSVKKWVNRKIISLNGGDFTLKDFEGVEDSVPFELVKNHILDEMQINFENEHINRIFFNLSTLSVMKPIETEKLMHVLYNYKDNLKLVFQKPLDQVLFLITGVENQEGFCGENFILNPSNDPDECSEIFYGLCMKNKEKTIFRFHQENSTVTWLQVFDASLAPEPMFRNQIILNKRKVLESLDNYFFLTEHCYIFVVEKKYYLTRNSGEWFNWRFKFLPSFHVGLINFAKNFSEGQILFREKCEKFPSVLLVVVDKEGQFILENVHGSVKKIRDLVEINTNISLTREEFAKKNKKITVIAGGEKSTVLWKLAKGIKDAWVFWVDLQDAKRFNFSVNLDNVLKFLLNANGISSSKLVEILLTHSFVNENSVPVHIFFDGYDEDILEMLQFLKNETRAKVWIGATEFNREKLEDELNVFAVELKNVQNDEVELCKKIWSSKICFDFSPEKDCLLARYGGKLMEKFSSVFGEDFFGIRMISEIFQPESEIENLNLCDLYSRFVNTKLDEYFEEKKCYFPVPLSYTYWLRKIFKEKLKKIGWKYTFHGEIHLKPQEIAEVNRLNLVTIDGDKIYFIDGSLADYFSARFLVDLMEKDPKKISFDIFSEPQFKRIRRFINDIFITKGKSAAILKFFSKSVVDSFNSGERIEILHQYAEEGNAKLIDIILQYFAYEPRNVLDKFINVRNSEGKTALHVAVQAEKPDAASVLLDFGACANIKDNKRCDPLHYSAVKRKMKEISWRLMKLSDNYSSVIANSLKQEGQGNWDLFIEIADIYGYELLSVMLQCALHNNRMDAALEIYKYGAKFVCPDDEFCLPNFILLIAEFRNIEGFGNIYDEIVCSFIRMHGGISMGDVITNLFLAAKHDIWNLIIILIKTGADVNFKNKNNQTILHFASAQGRTNIVESIIEKSGVLNLPDCHSATPIYLAAENNHWDIVSLLMEKVDINHPGPNGENVLHIACKQNKIDMIPKLISKSNVNAPDELGNTPVFLAGSKKNWDAVLKLINVADLNIPGQNGQSLLHLAVEDDELPVVIKLIENGADVNFQDKFETTPIFLAAECKHWEMVSELLKRGADPKTSDNRNFTLLHLACQYNEPEMALELIKKELSVNAIDLGNRTPVYFAAENGHWDLLSKIWDIGDEDILYFACRDNKIDFVSKLIEKGSDLNAKVFWETPVFVAAKNGHWDLVSKLLGYENIDVNIADRNGWTVLHLAAKNNQSDVALKLVMKGADVSFRNASWKTPIDVAAQHGHWDLVSKLYAKNVETSCILHLACKDGAEEAALMVINDGCDIDPTDVFQNTPLLVAAKNEHWHLVLKLLSLNANIADQNSNGETLCHFACRSNQSFIVSFTGTTSFKTTDNCGRIPLFVAAENGHWDLVLKLLPHSTVYDVKKVVKGRTILHLAAESNQWEVAKTLLEMTANERIMLDYVDYIIHKVEFDKNIVDDEGRTAILIAAEKGHWDFVEELMKLKADVTIPNKRLETVLHFACRDNKADFLGKLIEMGVDVNALDGRHRTPAFVAAEEGNLDLVLDYLLPLGGSGNVPDENGLTVLDIVRNIKSGDEIKMMKK